MEKLWRTLADGHLGHVERGVPPAGPDVAKQRSMDTQGLVADKHGCASRGDEQITFRVDHRTINVHSGGIATEDVNENNKYESKTASK